MNDKETTRSRSSILLVLVSALVIVVAIQAWYMSSMKQQIDELKQQSSQQPVAAATITTDSGTAARPQEETRPAQQDTPDDQAAPPPSPSSPFGSQRSPFDDDWFDRPFSRDWDPYREMQRMQREMDEIFNNAFGRFQHSPDFGHLFRDRTIVPDIDVQDNEDEYIVTVNLPGADENNVSVTLEDQVLTISGEQQYAEKETGPSGNALYRERRSGSYQRSISLPDPVSDKGMQTKMEHGVLTITIPKTV